MVCNDIRTAGGANIFTGGNEFYPNLIVKIKNKKINNYYLIHSVKLLKAIAGCLNTEGKLTFCTVPMCLITSALRTLPPGLLQPVSAQPTLLFRRNYFWQVSTSTSPRW